MYNIYTYICVCICVHIYIYDSLKNKTPNFAGILCSALQRKETWLRFPFASLKVRYQPNIFALPTRQSQPSPLESPFHRQDARSEPQLSCWRLMVLGEREANVALVMFSKADFHQWESCFVSYPAWQSFQIKARVCAVRLG